jgi:FkbM family methyltransferase
MKIVGFRYCLRQARRYLGIVSLLRNWRELLAGARKEKRGEGLLRPAVLKFKNGLIIEMGPGSYGDFDFLLREIFIEKCYQPSPDFIPRQGWTVVDLGANMGFFTGQAAKSAPEVKVISVEPIYVDLLKKNVAASGLANVTVIDGVVCGVPRGNIALTVWFTASGELKTGAVPPGAARVEVVNAPAYSLKQIFEMGQVNRCDLLKVDIEGAEYELFENISDDIWNRISRVVMEVHKVEGRAESRIIQILQQKCFTTHLYDETPSAYMLWATK